MIDIGLNLSNKRFRDDADAVVERALGVGVEAMILTGTSAVGSQAAADLAAARPGVLYSTAGVHPHDARHVDASTLEALRHLAARPEVVAIGECGLDHNRDFSPRPKQAEVFEAQLELAIELQLPVFMHERDAHDTLLEILGRHRDGLVNGVVHCFTGTPEQARAYLDLDLHIGVTGWICDERRGGDLQAAVKVIPLDRLMVETDAPYLTPRDLRPKPKGGRNEPAFLPHITRAVAGCMGLDFEEVAAGSTETARRFFRLA